MTEVKEAESLSTVTAAAKLGVGPSTVRYWIITGVLPAERRGGRWIIRPEDLAKADREFQSRPRRGRGRGRRGHLVLESADGADS